MAYRNGIDFFRSEIDRVLETLQRVKSMTSVFAKSFVLPIRKKSVHYKRNCWDPNAFDTLRRKITTAKSPRKGN